MTLDPSGTISGTVGGPGKWGFRVAVIDANAAVYGKNMSIEVVGATPVLASVTPYGQRFDDCTIGVPCTLGVGVT